jgi:hypothetical protein
MSCAARYSETTSLEFILNPFKFFFTNYVAKIAPHSPPNVPHLETKFRPPTILHSYRSDCSHTSLPLRCCLDASSALYCGAAQCSLSQCPAILSCVSRYVHRTIPLLYRTACLHTHTLLLKKRVRRHAFCVRYLFPQRATQAFGLHRHMPVTCSCAIHARFHT